MKVIGQALGSNVEIEKHRRAKRVAIIWHNEQDYFSIHVNKSKGNQ